jgi:hypothetical protein
MTDKDVREPVKAQPKAAPKPAPEEPKEEPVARAGGYVNRDDGNGWVPEEN